MPDGRYVGDPQFVGDERTRHFVDGAWAELPVPAPPAAWTLLNWFVWESGDGPLVCADRDDRDWGWLYDRDGSCAYRIGNTERVTDRRTAELMDDAWHFISVSKEGTNTTLWIDDQAVDRWAGAPLLAGLSDMVVMKHAVGYAKEIALFDRVLPDSKLTEFWTVGKNEFG